jgi:predicted 3-demethylubiquinone-9 3-methyltransferase (glyoxalase superfamily)
MKIVPNLWFVKEAEEAARYYTSIFKDSEITNVSYYGEAGPGAAGSVLTVDFKLLGQSFTALNGGPNDNASFNDGVSLLVECETQAELDDLWDRLTADGGKEVQCGWLKDRYGLSWQIVPAGMSDYLGGPDKEAANRAMKAMLGMVKLDIEGLRKAYEGTE